MDMGKATHTVKNNVNLLKQEVKWEGKNSSYIKGHPHSQKSVSITPAMCSVQSIITDLQNLDMKSEANCRRTFKNGLCSLQIKITLKQPAFITQTLKMWRVVHFVECKQVNGNKKTIHLRNTSAGVIIVVLSKASLQATFLLIPPMNSLRASATCVGLGAVSNIVFIYSFVIFAFSITPQSFSVCFVQLHILQHSNKR